MAQRMAPKPEKYLFLTKINMHRFYLEDLVFKDSGKLNIFETRITQQMSKVLRMRPKQFFHIFNQKEEWLMQIEEINKRKVLAKKVQEVKNSAEPKIKVSLYQAIPKKPALFELVVQKATEIGVTEIFPLITERTENRRMSKFERLHLIATEATEQCGRMNIPVIRHPVNYDEVIGKLSNGFIAYEYEGSRFLEGYEKKLKEAKEAQLVIGPEGGLSESELALAKESSVSPFTLGTRILRTETAAIAGLSLMLLSHPE